MSPSYDETKKAKSSGKCRNKKEKLTMSNIKTNSTISLAQVAGLINTLMEMLVCPKGLIWLEAFKRFLRKEKTWKFEKIFRVKVEQKSTNLHKPIAQLRKLSVEVCDQLRYLADDVRPVFHSPNNSRTIIDVVAIKLRDLIPLDKIGVWGYGEIVKEARKQGFDIPRWDEGLILGLQAAATMVELRVGGNKIVLCDPVRVKSGEIECRGLPCVWGTFDGWLATIKNDPLKDLGVRIDPDLMLILLWID